MARLTLGMCPLLSEEMLTKLTNSSIKDVLHVVDENPESLSSRTGIPYKDVLALRRVLLAQHAALPVPGLILYEDTVTTISIISTGCQSLDELLDGGLYTGEVTEVVGSAGCGKTQLCHHAAVSLAMTSGQGVIWLDTGSTLDTSRLQQLVEAQKPSEDHKKIFSRIERRAVPNVFTFLGTIDALKDELLEQGDSGISAVKLVVVDCITPLLSPNLGGKQTDGHSLLTQAGRALITIAEECALCVLVTNNSTLDYITGAEKPAMGRSWAHVPQTRLLVRHRGRSHVTPDGLLIGGGDAVTSSLRTATLVKSSRQACGVEKEFYITDRGLEHTDTPTTLRP